MLSKYKMTWIVHGKIGRFSLCCYCVYIFSRLLDIKLLVVEKYSLVSLERTKKQKLDWPERKKVKMRQSSWRKQTVVLVSSHLPQEIVPVGEESLKASRLGTCWEGRESLSINSAIQFVSHLPCGIWIKGTVSSLRSVGSVRKYSYKSFNKTEI